MAFAWMQEKVEGMMLPEVVETLGKLEKAVDADNAPLVRGLVDSLELTLISEVARHEPGVLTDLEAMIVGRGFGVMRGFLEKAEQA